MASKAVQVSLPRDVQGYVSRLVRSGRYGSAADVVRQALLFLATCEAEREAARDGIRRQIDEGVRQAQNGELIDAEDVRSAVRSRRAAAGRSRKKRA